MSTLGFDQKMIIKYLKLQGGNKWTKPKLRHS
jgi:hypothetical protein